MASNKTKNNQTPEVARLLAQANQLCAIDLYGQNLKVRVSSSELRALAPSPTQKTFRIIKDAPGNVSTFPQMIRKEE